MYSSQLQSWLLLLKFLSKDNKGLELSTKPGTRINKNFSFFKDHSFSAVRNDWWLSFIYLFIIIIIIYLIYLYINIFYIY